MDNRFSISKEFTGNIKPQFVLRFCGDWMESYPTLLKARHGRTKAIESRHLKLIN